MRSPLCFKMFLILCYHVFVNMMLISGRCQNEQQSILIQLKESLQFDSSLSTKLVSWNQHVPDCCSWVGIDCSDKGQVVGLDLSNEMILGGIDDSSVLFGLRNLERLNLAGNNFNFAPIPSRFGCLVSLLYLNLSNSRFSGQIPGELSRLKRLEVLDLSEPFSYGLRSLKLEKPTLATLVQNLTQLRGLYLDNVNISAQKGDWCQGLSSYLPTLEVLSLSNCQLSGPLDDSLKKLQSLSVIQLTLNNLSAPVPDFFADFKNLTVMNLGSCNLNGTFPEQVFQLPKLEILDLSVNHNLYGSLPDFPTNGSLRSLMLSHTNFSGGIPLSIGNLKDLSRIELPSSNFSGKIPKSMENLTQLVYLDLSSNNFTGQIPSFELCKNLTHVDLSRNGLSGMITSDYFQDLQNLVSVDLRFNRFSGSIPSSLFSLQHVQQLWLSHNNFDGLLDNFSNASLPSLNALDLSSNKLEGEIPKSFFALGKLNILFLSSNKLSGTIEIEDFQGLSNLITLDLSFNKLSVITSNNITILSRLPKLSFLNLASCNLQKFPNLFNQSRMISLDLSDNKIEGEIPSWIWRLGKAYGGLVHMNLSHNQLTGLQEPYLMPDDLISLDIHSNQIRGVIPILQRYAIYLDYSNNLFSSALPESIGRNLSFAYSFSVSNNLLTGEIPETICNVTFLKLLDFSNNLLTGRIPKCLIENDSMLGVLNLGNNGLVGRIEGTFPSTCDLNTLDLHGNFLEGKIPESIVNCTMLEVLNIRDNRINDTYPCFLAKHANLHVLVLRSNRFHGSVRCGGQNNTTKWSKLHILDMANNSFSGAVPTDFFWQWGAMMTDSNEEQSSKKHLSFEVLKLSELYYQDSVIVTVKGLELELVKILTIFTSIDISNNHFSGEIPSTIGLLKALYILNVSHNMFTGSIPRSIGNLSHLESLDMSYNKLTGDIPHTLTRLPFLSAFNLSYNQLKGRIPTGKQFNTFETISYLGNKRLCGFPLTTNCTSSVVRVLPSAQTSDTSSNGYDWQSIFHGMAVGAGSLTVIAVLYSLWKGKN